ncbi:hypothetical protein Btru_069631 [Bulinus truncatus]|nr:hypothetical protein Btru_069631 [Bulinus truncatus]
MRPLEVTVVGSLLMVILLLAHHTQSAPYRDDLGLFDRRQIADEETLANWILSDLDDFKRERKAYLDAGFASRQKILTKLAEAQEAHRQASDPYGPGRRK